MKKIIVLLLTLAMVMCLFACGNPSEASHTMDSSGSITGSSSNGGKEADSEEIEEEKKDDIIVKAFYEKLHLGSEIHRIDYLLMSMMGLQENIKDNLEACSQLGQAIKKLHTKRNIMRKNV